jgi:hypothetical protein
MGWNDYVDPQALADQIVNKSSQDQIDAQSDARSGQGSVSRELEAVGRENLASGARGLSKLVGGSQTLKDYATEQDQTAQLRQSNSNFKVRSLDQIGDFGDAMSYAELQALRIGPQVGAMALGGLGGGALAARGAIGLSEGAGAAVGTLAPQELQSIGDSGTESLPASVALGTASNMLNLAGVGGKVACGLPVLSAAGRAGRVAEGAARDAISQGAVSGGQAQIQEFGKAYDDPNYDPTGPEARAHVGEAAMEGAVVGGAFGAGHGLVSAKPKVDAVPEPKADTVAADETQGKPSEMLQLAGPKRTDTVHASVTPDGQVFTGNSDKTVGPQSSIPADLFTGATAETLRPTEGVGAMSRAISPDRDEAQKQYAVDLAHTLHEELSKQNPDQADYTIAQLEDHFQNKNIPVSDKVS